MKTTGRIKVLSAITAAALMLTLAGCGENTKNQNSSEESSKEESSSVSEAASSSQESSEFSAPESSVWYPSSVETASSEAPESGGSGTKAGDIPSEWQDNGIFSAYYDKAYRRVKQLSLEEKIGQMLYVACPLEDGSAFAYKYHLGGYVMFGDNFSGKTKEQVINEISSYVYSQEIPMTIAVDEEGGTVTRISGNKGITNLKFRSPRDLYKDGGMAMIQSAAQEKTALLKEIYIDVNFAPVCDISTNSGDFMYKRSLGQDAAITSDFAQSITQISQSNGVSVTLKHFPGYGNNGDTHNGAVIDSRDYDTFTSSDLLPFKAGIDEGAHLVMMSHNIVNCMDSTNPASLSPDVHKILREDLGFTGIIVTDDMSMGAITSYSGEYAPEVAAVLAGNDMLTISTSMTEQTISNIKAAVENGTIDEAIIDHAVTRILAWKFSKGTL